MTRKSLEDKLSLAEKQLQRMTRDVNVELSGFRDTVSALQKDVEQEKRKSADLSEKLDEKTRQLSKLQTLYDRQKRRPLFPDPYQQTQLQEKDALSSIISNPYQFYQPMIHSIVFMIGSHVPTILKCKDTCDHLLVPRLQIHKAFHGLLLILVLVLVQARPISTQRLKRA
ncbi:hypothetical protein BG011_007101 [Mortierella polycephala]|uniref:Uncharacterized protein n=1 Tax=Mortierella polycephala TaxID=41804 RepID=A0A9P6PUD8_9FUNG|nr:hypothetical protein BG011_007101 [Mortierella polycephala]